MNQTLVHALWLAPLFIPLLSYLIFRFLPARGLRLKIAAVVLLGIMIPDMFNISFIWDWFDVLTGMFVWLLVWELFWLFSLLRNKAVVVSIALIGLSLYFYANLGWFRLGPEKITRYWRSQVVSSHTGAGVHYQVKERSALVRRGEPRRFFALEKRVGLLNSLPLEKRIGSYATQKGFYHSVFSFFWQAVEKGVRADIQVDGYVIWTMGEEF